MCFGCDSEVKGHTAATWVAEAFVLNNYIVASSGFLEQNAFDFGRVLCSTTLLLCMNDYAKNFRGEGRFFHQ